MTWEEFQQQIKELSDAYDALRDQQLENLEQQKELGRQYAAEHCPFKVGDTIRYEWGRSTRVMRVTSIAANPSYIYHEPSWQGTGCQIRKDGSLGRETTLQSWNLKSAEKIE